MRKKIPTAFWQNKTTSREDIANMAQNKWAGVCNRRKKPLFPPNSLSKQHFKH